MNDNTYTLLLAQYNNFGECTLLDYWSEDLCRTFVLLVGSIWSASGEMHPKSDFVKPVSLVFEQCKKIDIYNLLPQDVVNHPELATWGISEFALIKVQSVDDSLFQFRVLWESDRYIEIICKDFYLRQTPLTVQMKEKYQEFFG